MRGDLSRTFFTLLTIKRHEAGPLRGTVMLPFQEPMKDPLKRLCPACQQGVGLAIAVSTLADRSDTVSVRLTCQSCRHEWSVDHKDPLLSAMQLAVMTVGASRNLT